MNRKTVYILIPVIVSIAINAFNGSARMIDVYCQTGSVFLGRNLSGWMYCYTVVYLFHILGLSAVFIIPMATYDKFAEIIASRAKLRYETDSEIYDGILNLTIFNDGNDLEERSAKYIGFGVLKNSSVIKDEMLLLPQKDRILNWADPGRKIQSGLQGTISKVVTVDWDGVHFGQMTRKHNNSDETAWRVGIELAGKIKGRKIKKNICITFTVNKTRYKYLIVKPSVRDGNCEWAKDIPAKELKKTLSK